MITSTKVVKKIISVHKYPLIVMMKEKYFFISTRMFFNIEIERNKI